jgi:hypothetical protein
MCKTIILHDDKLHMVRTQEELAKMVGVANLVFEPRREYCPDACLCPVDLNATAEKAGWKHGGQKPDGRIDALNDHWYRKEIDLHALLATWCGILARPEVKEAGAVSVPYEEMRALVALAMLDPYHEDLEFFPQQPLQHASRSEPGQNQSLASFGTL